jgi:hypothetical protein
MITLKFKLQGVHPTPKNHGQLKKQQGPACPNKQQGAWRNRPLFQNLYIMAITLLQFFEQE